MDPRKVRLATVWLGGCSGCHMSFLDMDEALLDLAARVELCYSPLADAKEFPEVDVTLVEGAVANSDHVHELQSIRKRTKVLVAFGDCAVTGNLAAMRNGVPTAEVLRASYGRGMRPGPELPQLLERVLPLHELVPVDRFLPGCPPHPAAIHELLVSLLEGRTPVSERRFG